MLQPGFRFATPVRAPQRGTVSPAAPAPAAQLGLARAYNEVKRFGRLDSTVRTPDRIGYAVWWMEFTEGSMNRLTKNLVTQHGTDLWDASRLFALLNMAMFGSYDLVCFFDCLHDMGDPVGALPHVRRAFEPDGTVLPVEPMAGDSLEENLHPVGATYYGFLTLLCTPNSLSQQVGAALGGAGRRGQVARHREQGWVHVGAARRRDAVHHGARGPLL